MNLKCKFGLHEWDIWQECTWNRFVFKKEKKEYRICSRCYKDEYRPLPPLIERIETTLQAKDREYIEGILKIYQKEYGLHAFNKAMLEVAKTKFKVPKKQYRHVTLDRLITYYMYSVDK